MRLRIGRLWPSQRPVLYLGEATASLLVLNRISGTQVGVARIWARLSTRDAHRALEPASAACVNGFQDIRRGAQRAEGVPQGKPDRKYRRQEAAGSISRPSSRRSSPAVAPFCVTRVCVTRARPPKAHAESGVIGVSILSYSSCYFSGRKVGQASARTEFSRTALWSEPVGK